MTKEFSFEGIKWTCTELERGWWKATTATHQITAPSWTVLVEELKASDPNVPRIDAVAFAEPVPGIGSKVGLI